jgi:hypothetical protein
VLRAPEVRARYGLGATLREGRFVGTIEIVRPEVRIERLPRGGISFPSFRGGGRDEGGGGVIEVRGIAIHDGTLSVDAGGPKREIGGIQLLGDVVVEKGATEILLRSGSCVVAAPAETVVALAGVMRLAGGRLEISSLGIETPNSDLSLHGVIAGPADTAGTRLEAAVKRLDLAEVERIQSLSPLHPGGHLGGRISLGSRGRAAGFDWNLTGRVGPDSLIVCSGHGDMAGSVLRISDLLVRSGPLEARDRRRSHGRAPRRCMPVSMSSVSIFRVRRSGRSRKASLRRFSPATSPSKREEWARTKQPRRCVRSWVPAAWIGSLSRAVSSIWTCAPAARSRSGAPG